MAITAPKAFVGDFLAHIRGHFIPHHTNNYHPLVFNHRLTSLWAILLVTVKVFTFSYMSFSPAIPAFSSAITSENIIFLTNESRKSLDLNLLRENVLLDKAAQEKANDMAKKGYFSHTSPDGRLPWDFIKRESYNYIMAGENLAVNFMEAESVNEAWMNSPTHKANIINKNFQEIGIGIAEGEYSGKNSVFVVQMFGLPSVEKISLHDEPTKVEKADVPVPAPAPVVKPVSVLVSAPPVVKTGLPLKIDDVSLQVEDGKLKLTAETSSNTVKVLAIYGQNAGMFVPKANDQWIVSLPLEKISEAGQKLTVRAFDINGKIVEQAVAAFSNNPVANYNFVSQGRVAGRAVEVFGKTINLQNLEYQFYLLFIAAVLTCLILAIAIKRHIQHISVVANGSFLAILAILLWMG